MKRVISLFTHRFLEPTHIAIAQTLSRLCDYRFRVYAKRIDYDRYFAFNNIESCFIWNKGIPNEMCEPPDIYHSIWDDKVSFRVVDIKAKFNAPYVVSLHGGRNIACGLKDPRYESRVNELFKIAEAFTVVAVGHREKLIDSGCSPEKVQVIPVGIDLAMYKPIAYKRNEVTVICQVARFIEKKGVIHTLNVFRQVRDRCPLTQLLLIGDGPLRYLIEEQVRSLGLTTSCHLTGLLPHATMIDKLNQSDIYLHPAITACDGDREGTPMILLEAQALQLPVVATRSGVINEIIQHGGTGLLAEEGDVDQLSKNVIELIKNPQMARTLGQQGRRYVSACHSIDQTVRSFDQLYRLLMSSSISEAHV